MTFNVKKINFWKYLKIICGILAAALVVIKLLEVFHVIPKTK